jgi:hypothetical protein
MGDIVLIRPEADAGPQYASDWATECREDRACIRRQAAVDVTRESRGRQVMASRLA